MTWNTSFQPLLTCKVVFQKSADSITTTSLQITVSFSLAAFKILSLSSILGNVIMVCLGMFLLGSNFFGTLSFLDFLKVYFLCQIGEVFLHYLFNNEQIFNFLLFLFSFWLPCNMDVGMFNVVSDVPKPLLIFLNSCFFILFRLDIYFLLLFQIVDLSPSFHPFTVGSLCIFL